MTKFVNWFLINNQEIRYIILSFVLGVVTGANLYNYHVTKLLKKKGVLK
jgi:hypothetical protein